MIHTEDRLSHLSAVASRNYSHLLRIASAFCLTPKEAEAVVLSAVKEYLESGYSASSSEKTTLFLIKCILFECSKKEYRVSELKPLQLQLSRIPRPQAEAIVLREMGDLSYYEISWVMGITQEEVQKNIFAARRKLEEQQNVPK